MDEQHLEGGNATDSVVRVGDTVRKPWGPTTAAVHELLRTVAAAGSDVPTPLGQDAQGRQVLFIDWDGASPSTRLWDLAYSAQDFTLNDTGTDPSTAAARLAALVDGYGADEALRADLPRTMTLRTEAMHELLRSAHEDGREPWGTVFTSGHGAHWRAVADHVAEHQQRWARALGA